MDEVKPEEISEASESSLQSPEEIGSEESNELSDATLPSEIEQLQNKIAELEDRYLRANAEFDNLKRRMEKEKAQAIAYAHEIFARDLLPVIDALEMAIIAGSSNEVESAELLAKVKEGIELTIEQFRKAFEKHGIALVDVANGFDPAIHEAVMQLESAEKSSGEILQVFQKGYKIKERVLRPAMVSIAK